ncbi:hypothetical protein GM661_18095 [Iocasia frigidifontis]|uniref:PseI/NeuA/B-like domain-containing protein n=1 Tax=Iocasia fonsfrigidae TaxID=2682810 RepID=A0A8A7KIU3_9FIRM|nr:N-acetylneuraminate synthase family protein [Iocasia fonsfrigidae]QTL99728.1 hypothetical protein GM661_18095 [Iocasia fonsfrigidae]
MINKVLKEKIPYLIAETAYSFEGDKSYLLKQINRLEGTQVDCIKFHMLFNSSEYIVPEYEELNRCLDGWLLERNDWLDILNKAKLNKLDTIILTDDVESVNFCRENNKLVDGIEVHAACINDLKILDAAIKFSRDYNKVFFVGISGFEFQELSAIIEYLEDAKLENVVLMYGFQNFPTKLQDINLSKIPLIKKAIRYKVGYADHTKYNDVNKENLIYTAYTLGANIQEVHYVLGEGEERTDYITGLSNIRLNNIKEKLINIHLSIGNVDFRLNKGEREYLSFRKVPVYKENLVKGTRLTRKNVVFKRVKNPKRQHTFREIEQFYGKVVKRNVEKNKEIDYRDLID